MQNQINTTPITQFTQFVRAAEQSQSKEVKIPITQARLMVLAMTEVLDRLHQDYETLYNAIKRSADTEVVQIQLDGGDFEDLK